MSDAVPRHPMRFVSERTGLSPHVLRVWERRYGAVHPVRSEGGQRLYSDADVTRLQLLRQTVEGGHNISQLVELANDALMEMIASDQRHLNTVPRQIHAPLADVSGEKARILANCLAAAEAMDARALENELRGASMLLTLTVLTDEIVSPLLTEMGSMWKEGRLGPAQEHIASAVIRRVLDGIVRSFEPPDGAPSVVVGTPVGQEHELGALLVAVAAGSVGWRVTYLGADLPATEILRAAESARARVIALSILYPRGDSRL
ncbi:MAG TPA: MerR family transcriptional regulator, partial [Candidatus Krumholzibacteria bacterium]|nr:MerR family transcriptional regulator [Candidatus Krumholzibacteria bacterium]